MRRIVYSSLSLNLSLSSPFSSLSVSVCLSVYLYLMPVIVIIIGNILFLLLIFNLSFSLSLSVVVVCSPPHSPPLTLPHPSDPPHAFLFFLYYSFYIFQHIFPIFCQGLTLTMFLYFYSKCVRFRQVSISFFTTERYFLNGKKPTNAVRPTQLVSRSSDSHSRRLLWLALVSVSERGIRHVR